MFDRCPSQRTATVILLSVITVGCGAPNSGVQTPETTTTNPAAAANEVKVDVTVMVEGLRHRRGQMVGLLFVDEDAFPTAMDEAIKRTRTTNLADTPVVLTFKNLPIGTYAVAVFHDENGNGKLESNFIGIPREGVGASNRAKGTLGPPSWDDANFVVTATTTTTTAVLQYP